jgi:hypothetical protein
MIAEGTVAGREAAWRTGECDSGACPPGAQIHGMDSRRTGAAPDIGGTVTLRPPPELGGGGLCCRGYELKQDAGARSITVMIVVAMR